MDFRALYTENVGYVVHSLLRMGVRPANVEDVAQDVFCAVHRHLNQYDPARPIRPWLFAFVFRLGKNHQRQARIRLEEATETFDTWFDVSEHSIESRVAAWELLQRLDHDERAVFVLHELEGNTMSEVRVALSLSERTAAATLRSARAKIQRANDSEEGAAHGN